MLPAEGALKPGEVSQVNVEVGLKVEEVGAKAEQGQTGATEIQTLIEAAEVTKVDHTTARCIARLVPTG